MLDNPVLDRIVGFFEADVLNLYTSHPDKYELDTDYFEGVLKTTEAYYNKLELSGRENEYIHVRLGYHSKTDGTLCVVVVRSDLEDIPEIEQRKWIPFIVDKSCLTQEDTRFKMWYDRYIEGSWEVESGPKKRLIHILENINACCKALVGKPLYTAVPDKSVIFPISQNSHAYEETHQKLYGFLVDSLSKKCLLDFASLRNLTIREAENMKPPTLLRHVFSELDKHSKLHTLLAEVSKQRSKPSHGVRDAAKESDAFEDFCHDLEVANEAYEELLDLIESEFSVSSDHELRRHEIMDLLPKIAKDAYPSASICQATKMEGKTVEKVWFGEREDIEEVHQSEVLCVKFTNGEILAIQTGSNASNLALDLKFGQKASIKPDEFSVDFVLTWVPASSKKR